MPYSLSIIVTAHNCAAWLQGTLDSIVASVGSKISCCEIIIINDASEDDTQAIIENFSSVYSQARYWQTRLYNIGQIRNYAILLATGDYILMVDGDDILLQDAIFDHLPLLEKRKPDIYLNKIIEKRSTDISGTVKWNADIPLTLSQEEAITRFLVHRDFQAHFIGQYFRRSLLEKNPFPAFICYEDTWLFPILLTQSNKILYSSSGFYFYRKHETSLSTYMQSEKIKCLLLATKHLDQVLPMRFQSLITCHWIDIAIRYNIELKRKGDWGEVKNRIYQQSLLSFLLNRKIRISYKRKMLKIRRLF